MYTTMTYNGRTNRETRLVNVHFNPETINDIEYIKSMLEDEVESIDNSFLQDFINL